MKKILKVILTIILLLPFCANAKEIQVKGSIHGDGNGNYFEFIFETEDGYIVSDSSRANEIYGVPGKGKLDIRLFKYKKGTLDVEWQTVYGGSAADYINDMKQCSSNEFVIVGGSNSADIDGITNKGGTDAIILKYDMNGHLLWQKSIGGNGYDIFDKVFIVDDGYIAIGQSSSTDIQGLTNKGNREAIIVKYDKDGNLLWKQMYGKENGDHFLDVAITNDGYAVIGNCGSDSLFIKYDINGNTLWKSDFIGDKNNNFYDVIFVNDGYIIVGKSSSTNIDGLGNNGRDDAIILKYDLEGNIIWQKSFGGNDSDGFNLIRKTSDDGFIVVGYTYSTDIEGLPNNGEKDALLIKYDKTGNIEWQKNYGGNDYDEFYDLIIESDGYLLSCYSSSSNINELINKGREDAIIVKFDHNGKLIGHQNYGGNSYDAFRKIIKTGNGYVAVGATISTDIPNLPYAGGYFGAWIMEYTINYDLQKETDTIKNGTYDIKQVGQRAEISLNPDNGYELDNIIVKDTNGNKLSYYEENGKYYVDLTDDIVVDVKYKQKSIINPNTGGLLMILEVSALIAIFAYIFKGINKKKQTN